MTQTTVIYVHGGEAFDGFWAGAKSYAVNVSSKWFSFWKTKRQKWPDTLESELSGFAVLKLKMPVKYNAKYEVWRRHFEREVSTVKGEAILVGWSLGANFLAKYLAENQTKIDVKAVHLIAGCYGLGGGFWLRDDFPDKLSGYNLHLYHSRDDFVVDFKDFERYQAVLPTAKAQVFEDRNHFLQPEFPELINAIKTSEL